MRCIHRFQCKRILFYLLTFGSTSVIIFFVIQQYGVEKHAVYIKSATTTAYAGDSFNDRGIHRTSAGTYESKGCPLPKLLIDDPTLKHFFKTPDPLQCRKEKNWVYMKDGKLFLHPEAIKLHGNVTCDYEKFWRVSDSQTLEKVVKQGFQSGTAMESDFAKVQCNGTKGKATFHNVYASVIRSPDVIKEAERINKLKDSQKSKFPGLNVYILGMDSVSRMTFMRKLPKTFKYLSERLKTVVLKGYNIVGDGTPQALIPILTGKTEVELPLTRKRYANADYCNVYPFVWNDFKQAGYVTLYGEDSAAVGTFTYRLKGFKEQPTDHYLRTFYTLAERQYHLHPKWCFGSEPQHKTFFDYAESFFNAYSNEKRFALMFHSILTHNNINSVGLLDDDLLTHIQWAEKKILNNTLFVLMADHGLRFASFRQTQQGQLEERLPFFSFTAPLWFQQQFPDAWKNLEENALKLTTPFDIYPTLKAIANWEHPKKGDLRNRSISLWDEVPSERTCTQAGIEPHWCACLNWETVSTDDPVSKMLAQALVQTMNKETEQERKLCSPLKVLKIESALMLVPEKSLLKYKGAKDYDGFVPEFSTSANVSSAVYQLRVQTTPGDALYEATIGHDQRFYQNVKVDLNSVSIINKYGDKPHCIIDKNYFLAKWCVCYDKIA